jgi:hypothetical protein
MKKLLILIFVILAQTGLAQNPPVSVLSQKWYEWTDNPVFREPSPFSATQSDIPNNNLPNNRTTGGFRKYFVYEAVIKNETDKKIIGLTWDYVIYAPNRKTEQSRQTFFFTDAVKKQKKKTLTGRKISPPGRTINAKDYEEKDLKPLEQVEIKCLLFDDKTTWKPIGATNQACEKLQQSIQRKEQFKKRH